MNYLHAACITVELKTIHRGPIHQIYYLRLDLVALSLSNYDGKVGRWASVNSTFKTNNSKMVFASITWRCHKKPTLTANGTANNRRNPLIRWTMK